jgi:hypothetical protein
MSDERAPIRSYQRIFKPDRRIYQVEGHRLPVPGGVPLRWLGWAIGTLLVLLALSSRSVALALVLAAGSSIYALAISVGARALIVGATVLGGVQVAGWLVGTLDWPLRLMIVPALVATLATHAAPDGRPAHRFALSWVALQVRPARRSLARPVPDLAERRDLSFSAPVAPDWRTPTLRRGRLAGPARVQLARPLTLRRSRLSPRRLSASRRPAPASSRTTRTRRIEVAAGETLELRP